MPDNSLCLSRRLYEETRDLHDRVERHPFQTALLRGQLPRERYVSFLEAMRAVQRALELHMMNQRSTGGPLAGVVRDDHFHSARLRGDLDCLVGEGSGQPHHRPPSQAFIARIEQASKQPAQLLGFLYVLEGSKNGGKFIAAAVRRAYKLTDAGGASFLDPYGENQSECWRRFKEDLDALALSAAEQDAAVRGAREAFSAMIELNQTLHEPSQSKGADES